MRTPRAAPALNLALATVGLALVMCAPAPPTAPALQLASADGALSLSSSREGAAIFHAEGMWPGASAGGSVRIVNTGTVSGTLRVAPEGAMQQAPGSGGGWLGDRLELQVRDVTDAQAPVTVYTGRLQQMGAVELGVIRAGEARQYEFAATMRPSGADNAYQGARMAAGFTWTAHADATAPPPAPAATPQPAAAAPPPIAGGGSGADPTGIVLGKQVFALPSSKHCVSRRKFTIHVRRPTGLAFGSVRIVVNRRTKLQLTGLKARRIKARVSLRGLPKGEVVVEIVAVTTTGRKAVSKRTYRTCAAKRRHG